MNHSASSPMQSRKGNASASDGGDATRRAFTLIELLVVVAIIGLLIAITVPALGRARQQAKATICKANLHAMGQAFMLYAQDYGGKLPHEDDDNHPEHLVWYRAVDPYLGLKNAIYQREPAPDKDPRQYMLVHTPRNTVKICPVVDKGHPFRFESYKMNSHLEWQKKKKKQSGEALPYRPIERIRRASQTVLLFDAQLETSKMGLKFKGEWSDVKARHLKKVHILFLDWHVEGFTRRFIKDFSGRDKNLSKFGDLTDTLIVWYPEFAAIVNTSTPF